MEGGELRTAFHDYDITTYNFTNLQLYRYRLLVITYRNRPGR